MDNRSEHPTERTPTEARAGSREGVTRYVLAGGLVLVIIAFLVAYGVVF
jgi:hypothetical protein